MGKRKFLPKLSMTFIPSFFLMMGTAAGLHFLAFAQENKLENLIDRVAMRQDSYPEYHNWEALAVLTETEIDKDWQPKKVTVIEKTLKVINDEETYEVLQVLETEKGVTKDITQKYIQKAEKEKDKKKSKEGEHKSEKEEDKGAIKLSQDEIFPFNEEKRKKYDFILLESSHIGNQEVYILESRTKIKSEDLWEGVYTIDKESFDVLKVKLKPSKNPKHIKEFEIEMSFKVLPEGYFVLQKSKARINGGIFIKKIRMTVEEERFNYKIKKEQELSCPLFLNSPK